MEGEYGDVDSNTELRMGVWCSREGAGEVDERDEGCVVVGVVGVAVAVVWMLSEVKESFSRDSDTAAML